MSRSSAYERMKLARGTTKLDAIAEAVQRGTIGFQAGRLLVRVATRETERAWVERATRRTYKHLKEGPAAAGGGVQNRETPKACSRRLQTTDWSSWSETCGSTGGRPIDRRPTTRGSRRSFDFDGGCGAERRSATRSKTAGTRSSGPSRRARTPRETGQSRCPRAVAR